MAPMWKNTERLRHVQLRHRKVMIHLVEHKMMATTGRNVNNIRFLCDELGELLVNYLVFVVPLVESMAWQQEPNAHAANAYLWTGNNGKPWSEARFGDMLKAACKRAEVPGIGTMVWRQMSSAIINKHFDDTVDRSCLLAAAQDTEVSVEDADEEGRDSLAASLVSMSNHSLRTHRMSYANDSPFANVWDGMLAKSYRASLAWARFFGLDQPDETGSTSADTGRVTAAATIVAETTTHGQSQESRKRGISDVSASGLEDVDMTRKLQNLGSCRPPRRYWSGAALLAEARKLYHNDNLTWRCPEQQQALRLVANRTPEVLLVLATGTGKSLTFMLGCSLPDSRTTIVVVPLVLLRLDLVQRCRQMAIEPVLWRKAQDVVVGMDGTPSLLFVSVEVATTPAFRQYTRRLYDTRNLDRIVFDECHLIQTSAHYRKSMARLSVPRELPVPFVYMTATLPPRLETILCQRHCLGRASVVRGCSKRPNIHYAVQHLLPPPGEGFLAHACRLIRDKWDAAPTSEWKAPRVMVFLRSCLDAENAAEYLGGEFYHREIGSVKEKEDRLNRWKSGESGSPFLACTTAAGAGVDYPHVRWVVNIEDPYGLGDYAQESGRAGRDGEAAGATVYMRRNPKQAAPPTPLTHNDPADYQALMDYLHGVDCRRLCLARDLDAKRYWKSCDAGDIDCDLCERRKQQQLLLGSDGENGLEETEESSRRDALSEGEEVGSEPDMMADEDLEQEMTRMEGGINQLRRQGFQEQHELDQYLLRLLLVQGTCVLCRILAPGRSSEHAMDKCPREHKWTYIRSKKAVLERQQGAKGWLPEYAACYYCGQPQSICGQWEGGKPRGGPRDCRYRDLAMPAMWALWIADGFGRKWASERIEVEVQDDLEMLIAGGRATEFGGVRCVLGVRVFADLLERWETGKGDRFSEAEQ